MVQSSLSSKNSKGEKKIWTHRENYTSERHNSDLQDIRNQSLILFILFRRLGGRMEKKRRQANWHHLPPTRLGGSARRNLKKVKNYFLKFTNSPETMATSTAVGTTLKTSALCTNAIPRVPRSIAFDIPPVCRFRWKDKSNECRWRNIWRAILRTLCCATRANTALRSSLNSADPLRAAPSAICWYNAHPSSKENGIGTNPWVYNILGRELKAKFTILNNIQQLLAFQMTRHDLWSEPALRQKKENLQAKITETAATPSMFP